MTYVVYEGPSRIDGAPIVALASGVDSPSINRKTGPMIQISILRADMDPWEALHTGSDVSICGDCIHRPMRIVIEKGQRKAIRRSCYVNLKFETPIYYAERKPWRDELADGAGVRFGTYGDPWAVPVQVWKRIADRAATHTGYTEFWRQAHRESPWWRMLFMASAQSQSDAEEAHALGWRYYRAHRATEEVFPWEILCPFYGPKQVQCIKCKLCDGARTRFDPRKSIIAPVHGAGSKFTQRSKEAQRSLPFLED